jgi:hypothetical protein
MNWLPRTVPSRERGAALVIVLALVVLLTGVGLAYLSRATSDRQVAHGSFNQSKADQVAASAMDLIIGGLRQEITGPSPTPTPPYFPLPYTNMVPVRFGTADSMPNLVRRSVQGDASGGGNAIPAPGYPSFASALNSAPLDPANPTRGEITLPRWNKHYLVPRPAGANPSDTAPIADFVAPDWVIITRDGPVAFSAWNAALADQTPANNSYAVGRYAYAIYDEGGLLDANVAGYPSSTTAVQYGPKGVAAFADLTALGMTQGGIDALVGWRNYFSAQNPTGNIGTFPNFSFNATTAGNYVKAVLSNTNGFMTVPVPFIIPNNMSRTDQQFPTRQSLIRLAISSGFTSITNALQYLTTFSRELNAPSWAPTLNASDVGGNDAGGIYAYATNANTSTAINRNLPGVRVPDGHSFVRADGATAAVGDMLINRRFPFTRIGGLGVSGPVTSGTPTTILNGAPTVASDATVQRDFGLEWNGDHWDYVGANGSNVQSTIERLDEIAAESREPNFFELLKAVILSGSVGMGSGSGNTFVAAEGKYYDTTNNFSSDYQIMQIGANIIDQWDANNSPTFINFGGNELAGIENLPYLNKLVFKPYFHTSTFDAWLLPSFWNPHQNAPPATQNVRLSFTSGTMTANTTSPDTTSSRPSPEFMTFDAHNFGTTSPSAPMDVVGGGQTSANVTRFPVNPRYWGFHFSQLPTTAPTVSTTAYPDFGSGCDFEMQVQVAGNWKTYQKWKGCAQPAARLKCQSPPDWTSSDLQDPEFVSLDPRTLRFGVWGNAANQSTIAADYTNGTQGTLDWPPPPPSAARRERITALWPQGPLFYLSTSPYLYLYASNADPTVYYTDLDRVQRLGDFLTAGVTTPMLPTASTDRPLILSGAYPPGAYANGGFQSMAELGHVFRDQPWKTLNFTTASPNATSRSADSGLLDVFTLHESSMEAGKTSLNTRHPLVLKAILSNATKQITGANVISTSDLNNIIIALTNLTAAQPMANKAELITRLAADPSVTSLGNKEARECVLRAFSDACQTRTWNLMIDVIAQSGRYPPNANSLAGFLVEGEQHYWVHVAIDRFTGQVIDKQIEVVNE